MKKILMGTSALALAGTIAGTAEAATWDLDWGGFYNSALIYRDSDGLTGDQDGVDVVQDGEIQFTPSIVLDNGLEFGVVVEIEADPTSGQTIDDSHVYVEGPFGHIDIGSESGAASKMHYGAPNVGWFGAADGGDVAGYLGLSGPNFGRSPAWAGAANRISYYTPRLAGFQVGASYAHDDNQSKNSPNAAGGFNDIFDLGVNYVNTFGAFDMAIGAVYSQADSIASNDDSDMYGGGISLAFGGITVGGNYTTQDVTGEANDRDYFDVGVAYKTGPWGMSFQYANSDQGASDGDYFLGAATYALGPGVTAGVYAGYGEADTGGASSDGFLVGTGFALSF